MKILYYICLILFLLINIPNTFAEIDFTVSPIKYEINTKTGSSITKSAILFNNSSEQYSIITGKSDFEANDQTGNPKFIRKSELVNPDQELANRIIISTGSFDIEPHSRKEITFTIDIPDNATPGGHYGAIFFKRHTSSSGAEVGINVDYGVLILINIEGEIIENGDLESTIIRGGHNSGGSSKDNCSLLDLTNSRYDGKCIDDFLNTGNLEKDINDLSNTKISDINLDDFNINFDTLFINEGNTHLKPTGKITLIDQDGKEIKGVGKKIVKNDAGAIIGEQIVDYLPINDNGGNVLPNTKRKFGSEWKGFPYEAYDEKGKKIIKYWTPEEYYTRINIKERGFILPWERINERINHEQINALIELGYTNKDGELIEFNSAKEFYVDYKEKYIGLNPYFFIILFIVILIILILWLLFKKKKRKCIKCKKQIDKDMIICPYCGTNQKKTTIGNKKKTTKKKKN